LGIVVNSRTTINLRRKTDFILKFVWNTLKYYPNFPLKILTFIRYVYVYNKKGSIKKSYRYKRGQDFSYQIVMGHVRLINDERMKAGRIVFSEKVGANENTLQDKLPAIITRISFISGGDGSRFIFLLTARRWIEEFRLLRPSAARVSWESGQWSLRTFLARVASRIWPRFFFLFPYRRRAIFWEVGVPLSGFRSIVFRPACFSSLARRECADVALARARAGTGPDYPYLFLPCTHVYRCPRLPWYAAFSIRRTGEVFSRWNTRGNSFRSTPPRYGDD